MYAMITLQIALNEFKNNQHEWVFIDLLSYMPCIALYRRIPTTRTTALERRNNMIREISHQVRTTSSAQILEEEYMSLSVSE